MSLPHEITSFFLIKLNHHVSKIFIKTKKKYSRKYKYLERDIPPNFHLTKTAMNLISLTHSMPKKIDTLNFV